MHVYMEFMLFFLDLPQVNCLPKNAPVPSTEDSDSHCVQSSLP